MSANKITAFSTILLIAVSLVPYSLAAQNDSHTNVLIGFKGKPEESVVKGFGGDVKYNFAPFINVIAASMPQRALEGLARNPNIAYVEPDADVHTMGHTSTIPEYQNSWGVDHIQADLVHPANKGTGIKVCIVDTGIDYNHPDLKANYVTGYDFVNSDSNPIDDNGHGTHVSGTVAAVGGNGGVIGVAPEVSLYAVKVLDAGGSGTYSGVIAGINWCVNSGTQIISMSLGGSSGSTSLQSAVDTAYSKNVLLVAAAGNSGNLKGKGNNVVYPARYDSVIAVAATTKTDARASFSSTGPAVELSAPGSGIQSTWIGSGYKTISGTSMATPHVSGSAALVFNSNELAWTSAGYTNGDGTWTNAEVRKVLDSTAQDLGVVGRDTLYGFGLARPDLAAK